MNKEHQASFNPEKIPLLDKKLTTKLRFRERFPKKSTRASKTVRKFIIQRQTGWNDSFAYDKIPLGIEPIILTSRRQYRKKSQNTENLSQSSRIQVPSQMKFRIQRSNSPNLFTVKSMPNHTRRDKKMSETNQQQTMKLFEQEIKEIYILKQIPQCHIRLIKTIISHARNKHEQIDLLRNELKDLRSPYSCIFGLKLICEARQTCLSTIKALIQGLQVNKQDYKEKLLSIKQHIKDLRTLGLNCIQKIVKWREQILYLCKCVDLKINITFSFCENDKRNYLAKLSTDTEFLHQSGLFKNSSFPDPFFLSYEEEFSIDMKKYFKIRACELLLLQQSL